jgi:hypothetical protein
MTKGAGFGGRDFHIVFVHADEAKAVARLLLLLSPPRGMVRAPVRTMASPRLRGEVRQRKSGAAYLRLRAGEIDALLRH